MGTLTLHDIEDLARHALIEHGLAGKGWVFAWDRAVRRAGQCHFGKRQISLSRPVFSIEANREDALDAILHEVAHALAGPSAGHGWVWKQYARQIGARPERCASTLQAPPTAIVGRCTCGADHRKARMPKASYACRLCRSPIQWERR
jgi:predicted SprT family Zn-dependent metalloprotease